MSERLLLKITEAADLCSVSRRKFYDLMVVNEDIRRTIVEVPGLRGKRIRRDLLERAIQRLSPEEVAA